MLRVLLLGVLVFVVLGLGVSWLWERSIGDRTGPDMLRLAPPPPLPSAEQIELRLPRGAHWDSLGWAVACVVGALLLFDDPRWLLGTAWLGIPAAVLLLLGAAVMAFVGWPQPDGRLVVDPQGLTRHVRGTSTTLPWRRVTQLELVTIGSRRAGANRSVFFVVVDDRGDEFLRESVPMQPAEAWARLQASLPHWSGRRLERIGP